MIAGFGAAAGFAQEPPTPDVPPEIERPDLPAPSYEAPPAQGDAGDIGAETAADRRADRLDELFARLAEPDQPDWQAIETEIQRIWARSGSPAMDLLLRRAGQAMEAGDYPAAIDHLTALTELAPDFAEAWNARATAFYQLGELSLALADVEHVLALNPRHYGALTGLGIILDQLGDPAMGLRALGEARRLNPNRPDIQRFIERLERSLGTADL